MRLLFEIWSSIVLISKTMATSYIFKKQVFHCSACRRQNQITAAVHYFQKQLPEVFCKKRCSSNVCKCHRKMLVLESVFNKVQLYPEEIPTQVFSCKICEIFKNPYFEELLETTASIFYLYFSSPFSLSSFSLPSEGAVRRCSRK